MNELIERLQEQLDNNWAVEAEDIQALIDLSNNKVVKFDSFSYSVFRMNGKDYIMIEIKRDVPHEVLEAFMGNMKSKGIEGFVFTTGS